MTRKQLIKLNNKIIKRLGILRLNNIQFHVTFNTNINIINITVFKKDFNNSSFWINEYSNIYDVQEQIEDVLLAIESDNYDNFVIANEKSL